MKKGLSRRSRCGRFAAFRTPCSADLVTSPACRGQASATPPNGTECVPERIAQRPVIRLDRLGVHCVSMFMFSRRRPSRAMLSMRGVAAPRVIPPP